MSQFLVGGKKLMFFMARAFLQSVGRGIELASRGWLGKQVVLPLFLLPERVRERD